MVFLEPERFTEASHEVWDGYFSSTKTDGFFEGTHMDFRMIVPLASTAGEGAWQFSKLEKVKDHILRLL